MARHLLRGVVVVLMCAAPGIAAGLSPTGMDIKLTVLTIAITEDCPASDAALDVARAEATRIWSGAAVGLRWVPAPKLPFQAPQSEWLLVQCSPEPLKPATSEARPRAVAMIRFLDAQPMNVITLSLHNAGVLLDDDAREGRLQNHQFPAVRQLRLGRMLGRALAHEIGHFLSQSEAHSERGLMKPTHSVAAFTGVSLQSFAIGADFRKVLLARRLSIDPLDSREPTPQ